MHRVLLLAIGLVLLTACGGQRSSGDGTVATPLPPTTIPVSRNAPQGFLSARPDGVEFLQWIESADGAFTGRFQAVRRNSEGYIAAVPVSGQLHGQRNGDDVSIRIQGEDGTSLSIGTGSETSYTGTLGGDVLTLVVPSGTGELATVEYRRTTIAEYNQEARAFREGLEAEARNSDATAAAIEATEIAYQSAATAEAESIRATEIAEMESVQATQIAYEQAQEAEETARQATAESAEATASAEAEYETDMASWEQARDALESSLEGLTVPARKVWFTPKDTGQIAAIVATTREMMPGIRELARSGQCSEVDYQISEIDYQMSELDYARSELDITIGEVETAEAELETARDVLGERVTKQVRGDTKKLLARSRDRISLANEHYETAHGILESLHGEASGLECTESSY